MRTVKIQYNGQISFCFVCLFRMWSSVWYPSLSFSTQLFSSIFEIQKTIAVAPRQGISLPAVCLTESGSQNLEVFSARTLFFIVPNNFTFTNIFNIIRDHEMNPTSNTTDVFYCETNDDCFQHGICTESKCICYPLWTGKRSNKFKIIVPLATF